MKHRHLVNDVVVTPDERRLRILNVSTMTGKSWVIDIEAALALPRRTDYEWLCASCKPQASSAGGEANKSLTITSQSASPAMIALRDRAWERIEPLVRDEGIYEPSTRSKLLCARAAEVQCSENTLLKDLRRYMQGGQTLDSLLGRYDRCGRVESTQSPRGRKRSDGSTPLALSPNDRKAMDDAIKGYYLKQSYHTLTAAHQWMLERYYTYNDGNGKKFIRPTEEYPSVKQLYYWLRTRYPLEHQLRARLGDKEFERDHRHKLGSIQLDCHGAGHMFEIDATIADVFLVSSTDPTAIVGKPTLYLIIDRATRLIVGWYVGFESASWMAAMQAILSIAEDKAALCRRYGVDYDPADWPAHSIQPEQFLADQGEMAHKNARRVSPGLRSTVSNVPGLRPDWKPLVECGFKMIHQVISQDLPAYDPPSNQKRRRSKAHYRDATLNLEAFTSLIVKGIVTHNRTMQTNFDLSMEQVAAGVQPVPTQLWTYEVQSRVGALSRFEADRVRLELLPREQASVTERGIELRGCLYTFTEGEKAGWFVQARRKRFKVDVSLDYRLCDKVIVYDPKVRGRTYEAGLVKGMQKFAGMSFAEVKRHFVAIKTLTKDSVQLKRQNLLEYHEHSTPIIKSAQEQFDAAAGGRRLSRKARRADTAADRQEALRQERASTSGVPSVPSVQQPTMQEGPVAASSPAPVVSIHAASPAANSGAMPTDPDPDRPLTLREKVALQRKKLLANG